MGKNEPGKARSGLSRIIFSRTGFILLLILIQLGIFVVDNKSAAVIRAFYKRNSQSNGCCRADLYHQRGGKPCL